MFHSNDYKRNLQMLCYFLPKVLIKPEFKLFGPSSVVLEHCGTLPPILDKINITCVLLPPLIFF